MTDFSRLSTLSPFFFRSSCRSCARLSGLECISYGFSVTRSSVLSSEAAAATHPVDFPLSFISWGQSSARSMAACHNIAANRRQPGDSCLVLICKMLGMGRKLASWWEKEKETSGTFQDGQDFLEVTCSLSSLAYLQDLGRTSLGMICRSQ